VSDSVESGHVIAVVQNGYMLGERVIRPALVRVAQ
jgi:molecular chaperone GrpE (heat shock protein)